MDKKYNLPAVIKRLYTFIQKISQRLWKLPENFSEHCLFCEQLVTTEFTRMLHSLKVQIHGCKQVFYFHKFRKVPLWKFPLEKNPPENVSDNFVKFPKFFPTEDNISENSEVSHPHLLKIKKYNSPAVTTCYITVAWRRV